MRDVKSVLIVAGHPLVHNAMTAVARSAFGHVRILLAKDLEDGMALGIDRDRPDLAILDLALPGYTGLGALRRFRVAHPGVPTVVLSERDSQTFIQAAFTAGAVGYLSKSQDVNVIVLALRLVHSGGIYVPPQAIRRVPDGQPTNPQCASNHLRLTDRQSEILRLIIEGRRNRAIAKELGISEGTVKQHVHAIFGALGVSSRAQAVATYLQFGLYH